MTPELAHTDLSKIGAKHFVIVPTGEFASIDTKPAIAIIQKLNRTVANENSALVEQIIKNSGDYMPPVLFALSRLLYRQGDVDNAIFWFNAARLRVDFDAALATDISARSAISAWVLSMPSDLRKKQFDDLQKLKGTIDRVIKWDATTPYNYDHRWISLHGLAATNSAFGEPAPAGSIIAPREQWDALAKKNRDEYRRGADKAIAKVKKLKAANSILPGSVDRIPGFSTERLALPPLDGWHEIFHGQQGITQAQRYVRARNKPDDKTELLAIQVWPHHHAIPFSAVQLESKGPAERTASMCAIKPQMSEHQTFLVNGYAAAQDLVICDRRNIGNSGTTWIGRFIQGAENYYIIHLLWSYPRGLANPVSASELKQAKEFISQISVCDDSSTEHSCKSSITTQTNAAPLPKVLNSTTSADMSVSPLDIVLAFEHTHPAPSGFKWLFKQDLGCLVLELIS